LLDSLLQEKKNADRYLAIFEWILSGYLSIFKR